MDSEDLVQEEAEEEWDPPCCMAGEAAPDPQEVVPSEISEAATLE